MLSHDSSLAGSIVRGIAIATLCISIAQVLDFAMNRASLVLSFSWSLMRTRSDRIYLVWEMGQLCLSLLGISSAIGLMKRKSWALNGIKGWCWMLLLAYLSTQLTSLYVTASEVKRPIIGDVFRIALGLVRWAAMPVFFLVLVQNETVLGHFQDNRAKGFEVFPAPEMTKRVNV